MSGRTAIERNAAADWPDDSLAMYRTGTLKEGVTYGELRLARDCIAHIRTLAQMYELSGGDWDATWPTRELHALAARIEEASSSNASD